MLAVLAFAAPSAFASAEGKALAVQSLAGGAKRITYRIGPFNIIPGQNSIGYAPILQRPQVDGYITRIRPDLTYLDGSVPRVDVIHLHHGVWINQSGSSNSPFGVELFFAAGEEKTIMKLPKGYGYPLKRTDSLILNHMIHNLTPVPTQVYMVYQVDFAPKGSPAARGIRPVTRFGWTWRPAGSTPCSTCGRAPAGRVASRSRTTPRTPTAAAQAEPVGRGQAGRAGRHRRPPPSGRAPHRSEDPPARAGPPRCSAHRPSTSSPRGRCRGTSP